MAQQPALSADAPRVLRVKPAAEDGERSEPLRIQHTRTRSLPEAREALRRVPGLVNSERSPLAETFKMLRSQVLQRMRQQGHKLVAVTSPRAVDGKTPTAVNLALTLAADLDTAVVLVDADLTRRQAQHLFGLEREAGLAEHLTEGLPLADLLVHPGIDRLVVLPAARAAVAQSAELLGTKALRQLSQEMKLRYADRVIVVDLPPLLDTADALAFLPQVDTTLVVVEEETSTIADIAAANELLAPFDLIGTVLSRPAPKPRRRWFGRF